MRAASVILAVCFLFACGSNTQASRTMAVSVADEETVAPVDPADPNQIPYESVYDDAWMKYEWDKVVSQVSGSVVQPDYPFYAVVDVLPVWDHSPVCTDEGICTPNNAGAVCNFNSFSCVNIETDIMYFLRGYEHVSAVFDHTARIEAIQDASQF